MPFQASLKLELINFKQGSGHLQPYRHTTQVLQLFHYHTMLNVFKKHATQVLQNSDEEMDRKSLIHSKNKLAEVGLNTLKVTEPPHTRTLAVTKLHSFI